MINHLAECTEHTEKIEVYSFKANANNENYFNHRKTFMEAKNYNHSIFLSSSENNIYIIIILIKLKLCHDDLGERGGWEGDSIRKELNPQLPGQRDRKCLKLINQDTYL